MRTGFKDYLDLQADTDAGEILRKEEYARMVEAHYSYAGKMGIFTPSYFYLCRKPDD